jgi:hypothetical protein
MKELILKAIKIVFVTLILQFLLITIYIFYYHLYFKKIEIENSSNRYLNNCKVKNFIMGNSMVETDLNDTLLGDNFCNLGKGAEPIFYSVVKSRYLIESYKPDTIFIEYSNVSLNQEDQVISDERCFQNYSNFFKYLNFQEHWTIAKNNPLKFFKVILSLRLKNFINDGIIGGYAPRKGCFVNTANLSLVKIKNWNKNILFDPLFNLINDNPKVFFVIFRLPLDKRLVLKNNEEYISSIKKLRKLKNMRYFDLSVRLQKDRLFYDLNHLNYGGSVKCTIEFLENRHNYYPSK